VSWVDVAFVTGGAVLLVLLLAHTATMIAIYRGTRKRRPVDISGRREPVVPVAAPLADELVSLGFQRLGEAELVLPSTSLLGPLRRTDQRHVVWVFVDDASTTHAELTDVGPFAAFSSSFPDGSVAETMFPRGERIDDRDYYSGHVTTSLADAYNAHRRVVDHRSASHGPPREMHSMGEYLRLEADFRERFAARKLRRPLILHVLLPAGVAAALVIVLVASIVAPR
jgi:hypothetical protein